MAEPRCYECGHILGHIDEACPVCLPNFYGPRRELVLVRSDENRLRQFLTVIRDNPRSGAFAQGMAKVALNGLQSALNAETYWQAQTDEPVAGLRGTGEGM